MRDPAFWWTDHSIAATLLAPFGACYGAIATRNMARPGRKAPVPVICVGNFTLGGAGKTPTAMALARLLLEAGHRPFFLSRGYGGQIVGPVRIDNADSALLCKVGSVSIPHPPLAEEDRVGERVPDVGDEPLLLARVAPTVVARNRPAGVRAAVEAGADTIIMDDGLQNPSVDKDLVIAVVDGRRGIGNGRIFPAGPLRAPLEAQLDHIDAVLVVGSAGRAAERAIEAAQSRGLPLLYGDLHPSPDAIAALAGKPVLAFAGIGDPDKFFATLEAHGIPAKIRRPFPDHHRYAVDEMSALVDCAERNGLTLVTTEKDLARLSGDPAAVDLIARSTGLPVTLRFGEVPAVEAMLRGVMRGRGGPIAAESAFR